MAEGLVLSLRTGRRWSCACTRALASCSPTPARDGSWRGLDGRISAWLEEMLGPPRERGRQHPLEPRRGRGPDAARRARTTCDPVPGPASRRRARCRTTAPPRVDVRRTARARERRPEVLLRAAPKVLAEVPDARFVFVGRDAVAPGRPPSTRVAEREAARLGVSARGRADRAARPAAASTSSSIARPYARSRHAGRASATLSPRAPRSAVRSSRRRSRRSRSWWRTGSPAGSRGRWIRTAWADGTRRAPVATASERAAMGVAGTADESPRSAPRSGSPSWRWPRTSTRSIAGGAACGRRPTDMDADA